MDTATFFEYYFNNAEVNSILIMDRNGIILDLNRSFTNNFQYTREDLKGKSFEILFIKKDNDANKPQLELDEVLSKGQSHDDNYIINKNGDHIWCTGEVVLVIGKNDEKYIVKDIVNLQAKKQLQLFLKGTEEVLERIFDSSKELPMMIIDGSMKIKKVNTAFLQLFELDKMPESGSRLSDLHHPFWINEKMKTELRKILVNNYTMMDTEFELQTKAGYQKQIRVNSKNIDRQSFGRQIFIIIEDITL